MSGTNGVISQAPFADSSTNTVFNFSVTGMSDGDTVGVTISSDKVEGMAGNGNQASSSTDNQVNYPCDDCDIEDQDNDGMSDREDNCPNDANPSQLDSDQDDVSDACIDQELCIPVNTRSDALAMICL